MSTTCASPRHVGALTSTVVSCVIVNTKTRSKNSSSVETRLAWAWAVLTRPLCLPRPGRRPAKLERAARGGRFGYPRRREACGQGPGVGGRAGRDPRGRPGGGRPRARRGRADRVGGDALPARVQLPRRAHAELRGRAVDRR